MDAEDLRILRDHDQQFDELNSVHDYAATVVKHCASQGEVSATGATAVRCRSPCRVDSGDTDYSAMVGALKQQHDSAMKRLQERVGEDLKD